MEYKLHYRRHFCLSWQPGNACSLLSNFKSTYMAYNDSLMIAINQLEIYLLFYSIWQENNS